MTELKHRLAQYREVEAYAIERGVMSADGEIPDALNIAWLLGGYEKALAAVDYIEHMEARRRERAAHP